MDPRTCLDTESDANSRVPIGELDNNDDFDRVRLLLSSAQLGRRNESQGSQVLGGAGRYGPFWQGGRTYLREPAHSVGAAQEARGLPRSQAGGASTEECAAHRSRQASRGARPPHAQRERRNRRARAQQYRSIRREAQDGLDPDDRTLFAAAGNAETSQGAAAVEPHALRVPDGIVAKTVARRRNRSWPDGAPRRSGRHRVARALRRGLYGCAAERSPARRQIDHQGSGFERAHIAASGGWPLSARPGLGGLQSSRHPRTRGLSRDQSRNAAS